MDTPVALMADDQRLPTTRGHDLDPSWGRTLASTLAMQVLQVTDVMDLDPVPGAAELAGLGSEPLEQLRPSLSDDWPPVVEDRVPLPGQRDATPPGYKRPSPRSFHP